MHALILQQRSISHTLDDQIRSKIGIELVTDIAPGIAYDPGDPHRVIKAVMRVTMDPYLRLVLLN